MKCLTARTGPIYITILSQKFVIYKNEKFKTIVLSKGASDNLSTYYESHF